MACKPDQNGLPIDRQFRRRSEPAGTRHDDWSDYTHVRPRVILMNGVEVVSIIGTFQSTGKSDDRAAGFIAE